MGTPLSGKYAALGVLALLSCALVLYDEYRLVPNGLLFGIPAILLTGSAKALFYFDFLRNDLRTSNANSGPNFTFQLVIWISFAITAAWTLLVEDFWAAIFDLLKVNPLWVIVNILSAAVALVLGGSFFYRLPLHPPTSGGKAAPFALRSILNNLFIFMSTCIIAMLATFIVGRSYSTAVQIIAFAVTIISSNLVSFHVYSSIDQGDNLEGTQSEMLLHSEMAENRLNPTRSASSKANFFGYTRDDLGDSLAFILTVSTFAFGMACLFFWIPINFRGVRHSGNLPAHLDTKYVPTSDLDVVISMYKEPVEHLNPVLETLQKLPAFSTKSQRIIIYTKDERANIESIKQATRAFNVTQVPNVGREGETYLRHILEHWDDLAKHTMFIQADIHNPREFIPRVRDYFDPEQTGMLSLGFSGNVCDCNDCGDRFGWHDDTRLIKGLYHDVYQTEKTCSRALLSYKGQFIASARRIRGVNKKNFKDLWTALSDPDSWAHQQDYLKGRDDEMSAPFFGYTLERLWNVLFQCSDMNIAWTCPTLLSGTRRGGSKADCQCFDELESKD